MGSWRASPPPGPANSIQFLADFYNTNVLLGKRVSEDVVHASFNVAAGASAKGTYDRVPAWLEDFRDDLPKIDVAFVIHGKEDRILPIDATGRVCTSRGRQPVRRDRGGASLHHLTHAEDVNRELVNFLGQDSSVAQNDPARVA